MLQLTKVLSNRALNEVSSGYASYLFGEDNLTTWTKHWMANGGPFGPITTGSPRITFTNFTIARQQRRAALPRPEPLQHQGQLHVVLRCARAATT